MPGSGYLQVSKRFELKWPRPVIIFIFRPSRAPNSIVCGGIRSKLKLIKALMHGFVTYNKEEDKKNESPRVATTVHPL